MKVTVKLSGFELKVQEIVDRVPVISLWNPWAWLVVYGPKDVENRTWRPPSTIRTGEWIYLHAGLKEDPWTWTEAQSLCLRNGYDFGNQCPPATKLQWGGIIGRARLVDVLPPAPMGTARHPWHMPEQWGWVLADREPVPFVPMRGYQRIWRVPRSALG